MKSCFCQKYYPVILLWKCECQNKRVYRNYCRDSPTVQKLQQKYSIGFSLAKTMNILEK